MEQFFYVSTIGFAVLITTYHLYYRLKISKSIIFYHFVASSSVVGETRRRRCGKARPCLY